MAEREREWRVEPQLCDRVRLGETSAKVQGDSNGNTERLDHVVG